MAQRDKIRKAYCPRCKQREIMTDEIGRAYNPRSAQTGKIICATCKAKEIIDMTRAGSLTTGTQRASLSIEDILSDDFGKWEVPDDE